MTQIFEFPCDSCCTFVYNFTFILELTIFIASSLKNSRNLFMQSLLLCTSCLFSMFLNEDIIDIEKWDGIYFLVFVVDEFSRLFLHQ